MRRGEHPDREIQLITVAEREFELFKYKMLSKSRKRIFDDCGRIRFYSCIYEYLMYVDDIKKEHIEVCLRYDRPIAELYRVYQDHEHLRYDRWEDIEDLLDVLVHEQEGYRGPGDHTS